MQCIVSSEGWDDSYIISAVTARPSSRDGVFLQIMKLDHWVLVDELNILSLQSVLEGLHVCFDHR